MIHLKITILLSDFNISKARDVLTRTERNSHKRDLQCVVNKSHCCTLHFLFHLSMTMP
jgi:hypothetical protein